MTAVKIVKPIPLTEAMLVATNVTENDYSAIANSTPYALGARVISTSTHKVYECVLAYTSAGSAVAPNLDTDHWVEVGPTNRWKAWDTSTTSKTAKSTSITYQVTPGLAINAVAARGLVGATSVRVRLIDGSTLYDQTVNVTRTPVESSWWEWFFGERESVESALFIDLPAYPDADLYIDIAGGTDLAVGVLLFGQMRRYGIGVQHGATVGIQDYSRKEPDDFGEMELIERNYSDRASFDLVLNRYEVDSLKRFLTSIRATPVLVIADDYYEACGIFGFVKDFEILIAYHHYSECSLDIEGMT